MATRKKVKKSTRKAGSAGGLDYKPIEMYTAVVVTIILAVMVITFASWKIRKNSDREVSTRGYAKLTKMRRDYPSLRSHIRAAMQDDKVTYKELKDIKAKYREAAKRSMK